MLATLQSFASRYLLANTSPLSDAERSKSALGSLIGMWLCGLLLHAMLVGSHC